MAASQYDSPFSFSEYGKYFAHCGNDGKLKIWDTSTGALRQEYTKNLHLASPCTCLIWLQSSKAKSPKKRKLGFLNLDVQDVIAIGTANGSVMFYSVETNSLLSEESGHSNRVNDLSLLNNNLYSASDDKHIIQWDLSTHKIKSKWKSGKEKIKSLLALSDDESLLTASCSIKLWNIENKQVIKSFVGHASPVFQMREIPGTDYFVTAARGDRTINAWCLSTSKENSSTVASFLLEDGVTTFNVNKWDDAVLCAVSQSGVLHVFSHKLNGTTDKPIKPKKTVTVATEGSKGTGIPLPVQGALAQSSDTVLMAYASPAFLAFETLNLSQNKEDHVVLLRQLRKKVVDEEFNSRTRVPDTKGEVEYVNNSELPSTSETSSLRKQRDVPLERRLENLTTAAGVPDAPRKDNLSQLLVQGLQSRDRDLLHDVLFRAEEKVISSTVRHLPIQALLPLVREINNLLQGKTFTNRVAVRWLNALLRHHSAYILSNQHLKQLLSPLATSVDARVQSLPNLLRLRGKLSLVAEQVTCQAETEEGDEEPLVSYQDKDSSESEQMSESEMSDADVNDWNELSDDDDNEDPV